MMNSGVVCHGDCDGVISAYLYIKHYLADSWPAHVSLVFTQPWRAHIDVRKLDKNLRECVFLDLAINDELARFLKAIVGKVDKLVIIDHHKSSKDFLTGLTENPKVKAIWSKAPSCPRLMAETLNLSLNPYEKFLIDVADVCEGSKVRNKDVADVADMIKLSIARDPSDVSYMFYLVKIMLEGKPLSSDPEVIERAKVSKFLLKRLLKLMSERALEIGSMKIIALTLPESRVYAGLLGIAATEFARITHKDVILVRREENKVVVTTRTLSDRAYKICKELANRVNGKFGGHGEAASATLPDMGVNEAVKLVTDVIRSMHKKNSQNPNPRGILS